MEAITLLLMLAQESSQRLFEQVQAQLVDAGEPVTTLHAAEVPRSGLSAD